jgi:hypothetical protein
MANKQRGEVLWSEVVQVLVSESTKASLAETAVRQGLSQSAMARKLLEKGLEKEWLAVSDQAEQSQNETQKHHL